MSSSTSNGKSTSGDDDGEGENMMRKGPWTQEEDAILAAYVKKHGEGNWNLVQKNTGLFRCGKSCRLRWTNHLRSNLKRGAFTKDEERKLLEMHAMMGNKWSKIAQQLPGRTDNEIKNFWHTRRKKLKRAKLPLYPPHLKVLHGDHENGAGSSRQKVNVSFSQEDQSDMPEERFNKQNLSDEHPLHVISENGAGSSRQKVNVSFSQEDQSDMPEERFNKPNLSDEHPLHVISENGAGSSRQKVNVSFSQEDQSDMPEERFNKPNPSDEHPLHVISESTVEEEGSDLPILQPQEQLHGSDILYKNSLGTSGTNSGSHDHYKLHADCSCGQCERLSGTPYISLPMVSELPPFPGEETDQGIFLERPASPPPPSIDESSDAMIQYQSEPVSPRSNGYLESIFYPPKILDGSDNTNSMNPCETRLDNEKNESQNQREETSVEPCTDETSHDKYESAAIKDNSLFEMVDKFLFLGS